MSAGARIAVALDTPDLTRLAHLAARLGGEADILKVGLEALTAIGPRAVEAAAQYAPVFCDLKLHDIPQTVAGAAAAAAAHGVSMITVHASGGPAMIDAAVKAAPTVEILAVTILTSLDDATLAELGIGRTGQVVPRLALGAINAGATGIVCAGDEVSSVRRTVGAAATIVVPGVRPEGTSMHDQARVVTPHMALLAGADVLVVGRPVTAAGDPVAALRSLRQRMTDGA